jgi:hypothetical protein
MKTTTYTAQEHGQEKINELVKESQRYGNSVLVRAPWKCKGSEIGHRSVRWTNGTPIVRWANSRFEIKKAKVTDHGSFSQTCFILEV